MAANFPLFPLRDIMISASTRQRSALLILLSLTAWTSLTAQQSSSPQRAVLVTGASSGIGRKIAELLASQGHFVYAGARKAEDIA